MPKTSLVSRLALASVLAGGTLLVSTGAHAQVTTSVEPGSNAGLGEIIVTAQRREQRLQDVPLSISAFTADTLEQEGITSTKDLTIVTPSLNFTQSSYSPQPTIRGIGTRGVSASEESVVPVYVDGVYQSFIANTVFDLNNVERIEVLRGPQTALYGRNSTGGAINVITLTPTIDPYMRASISYGRFNQIIAKGYASVGNDLVQVGIGALVVDDDGYIKDLNGRPNSGWSRSADVRGKLRFTPGDDIEVILAGSTSTHSDTFASNSQPFRGNTVARRLSPATYVQPGPFETNSTGGQLDQKQDTASLTAKFDLGGAILTSISGYDDSFLQIFADIDATTLEYLSLPTNVFSESFVQELYLTSDTSGPFEWVFGATYFWRDAHSTNSQVRLRGNPISDADGKQITDAYAVYGQGTYDVTDALSLTVAGRYTKEKKNHSYRDNLSGITTQESRTFNDFSPSATLQYDFSPDANIYARVGKGFKSGLYATTTASYEIDPVSGERISNSVEPEKVWQYEIGTKFAVNNWLRTNLAAFYTDYTNIQVNIRPNNVSRLQNAGSAEIYGIEGEIFAEPVDKLNLRLGFMKLWGEFTDFKDAIGYTPVLGDDGQPAGGNTLYVFDATGQKIIRTPLYTLSASANYTVDLADGGEVIFSANAYHAGKEYRDADNRVTIPAYTVVNGEIGYRLPDSRVKLSLWGRNLFNEVYNLYILTGGTADSTVYARPRSFGVRLDMEFGR